jgi:hypothetical protein
MVHKYVEEKLVDKPPASETEKEKGKFDCITKLAGSLNAKVIEKQKTLEKNKQKLKS